VLDLVSHLDKNIYKSEVLSFTKGEMVDRLSEMGIPCYVIPTTKPFDFSCWGKVKKLIQSKDYHIIHAHGTRACSNTFWAAGQLKLPLIYTVHGWSFHPDQQNLIRFLRKSGEKVLVKRTQKNITVSKSNQQQGIDELGLPNSVVIHNGVNLNKFDPAKEYHLKRSDFGLKEDDIVVGFMARLTHQKDPVTLIRAAAIAAPKAPKLKFILVGNGDLDDEVREERQKLGMEDRVVLEDFRTDVPDVLSLIDIYCLPSLWEGLPIGVIEAMAMQKAVIATPVNGTKELIEDGINGLLIPEKKPDMLAKAFLKLYENPELIKKYGEASVIKVKESFNVQAMAHKVSEVYQNVLSS